MVDRHSALAEHYRPGHFGVPDRTGVTLCEVPALCLYQIAAWPETLAAVGVIAAQAAGCPQAPLPGQVHSSEHASLLRVEPLKWWLLGGTAPELESALGCALDLSHSRTHLRISGSEASALLNRHLPLDLREAAFPVGRLASTAFHHVGVTLWRSEHGYELFLPRGFAVSLWEGLLESATQFGVEIV